MPEPKPIGNAGELSSAPCYTVADVPPGAPIVRGKLIWFRDRSSGRPLVGIKVERCHRCRKKHQYLWKWSWGIDPAAMSYQAGMCRVEGVAPCWVGLDPDQAAASEAAYRESHEAFEAWKPGHDAAMAERAERKAARTAQEPATTETTPTPAPPPAIEPQAPSPPPPPPRPATVPGLMWGPPAWPKEARR